jgi:hypothetical protein
METIKQTKAYNKISVVWSTETAGGNDGQIQADQKVSVHMMITVQKTTK